MQSSNEMASFTLFGISVSQGVSIGRAHVIAHAAMEARHYLVPEEKIEAEVERLELALHTVGAELTMFSENLPEDAPPELSVLMDVHAMLLADDEISKEPFNIIRTRRYNAEWALMTKIEDLVSRFDNMSDPYLRERKADIQQIGDRVLMVLTGTQTEVPATDAADQVDMIVVAHDISPADMIQFRDSTFSGFVSEIGGRNSHAAIVARSVDTPAVFGLSEALSLIRQDDWLIVDADAGVVIVNPTQLVMEQYRNKQSEQQKLKRKLNRLKKVPAVTQDGTAVELLANIEFPDDCRTVMELNATGVGLFRSEFLFMGRGDGVGRLPDEEEQFEAYKQAVTLMKGRPVTIRTLDIGADKQLDDETLSKNVMNPALGKRAIRFCLAEPELFLTQLRAILRASAFGQVKLLIPMLVYGFEIDQALGFVEEAKAQLRAQGRMFDESIQVGAMIEVPAAVLSLPMFTSRMDFLSIGSNDLIQYALAVDRVDPDVAHLYNPLHPAVLAMIQITVEQAEKADVPLSVCGEMAGDPHLTRLLLALGIRQLSMHPTQLLQVKQEVLLSDLTVLKSKVKRILSLMDEQEIEAAVQDLYQEELSV